MGILQDVFNALQAFEITKIDRQPMDDDINKLTTQLTAALVTILTTNGGGKLGLIQGQQARPTSQSWSLSSNRR